MGYNDTPAAQEQLLDHRQFKVRKVNSMVRFSAWLVVAAAIILAVFFWRQSRMRDLTLEAATRRLEAGDLSTTLRMLRESAVTPEMRGKRLLLMASASRQLRRMDDFLAAIDEAAKQPTIAADVQIERRMCDAQLGRFEQSAKRMLDWLISHDVSPLRANAAILEGHLSKGQTQEAASVLTRLKSSYPNTAPTNYLGAAFAQSTGNTHEAERLLLKTIQQFPKYELAYIALAEIYASENVRDLAKSKIILEQSSTLFPDNDELLARYASVLRQLGAASQANSLFDSANHLTRSEQLEHADALADQGQYEQALGMLKSSGQIDETNLSKQLDAAFGLALQGRVDEGDPILTRVNAVAVSMAFGGQPLIAHRIFDMATDRVARIWRLADLEIQLSLVPQSRQLQNEYRAIKDQNVLFSKNEVDVATFLRCETIDDQTQREQMRAGVALYELHCAQCHGPTGDGLGRAASHLSPAPRSFVGEPMRYVSAVNHLATDGDLRETISKGLAGASMPAFPKLTSTEIGALVTVLRRFQQVGLESLYARTARVLEHEGNGPLAPAQAWISAKLNASDPIQLPEMLAISEADNESGRILFERVGCIRCHNVDNNTDATAMVFLDSLGRSITARKLRKEPLRRGGTSGELAKRILLGVPGTPHPATDLPPDDLVALIGYVESLVNESDEGHGNYWRMSQSFSEASSP